MEIAKPQELVYALVRDLERAPAVAGLARVGRPARGHRGQAARRPAAGIDVPRRRGRPASRLAITSEGGPAAVRATFDLEPAGDGTLVRFKLDIALHGAARFAGRIVKTTAQREVRSSLQKLKEVAEE